MGGQLGAEYARDSEAGKIDILLCTKLDRVSRSLPDFYSLVEMLEDREVAFVSLKERWDSSDAMGRFALKMILIVAELEREQTSERTSQKAAWRATQGLKNGGQLLGYDIDPERPGVPLVNPEEKDLVLLIYRTYLKEKGLRRTAEDINRRGYRTKSFTSRRGRAQGGKLFTDVGISRILTNPVYIGKVRHKDQLFDGQHEPIVPVELFEKVQRTIAGNRGKRGRPQERHLFVLNGLVRCGGCGAYMTPTFSYNAQKRLYSYYACTNRNHRGTEACKTKPVPAEPLEQVIADRLIQLSNEDRTIERIVQEAMSGTDELLGNLKKRRTELKSQGRAVTEKIDALIDGIAGRRKIKSVGQRIVELEERQEQLEDEALDVDLEIQATKAKAVSAQSMTESLTTFGDLYREAIPEERRELIRLRVNQLIWTPDEIRVALLDTPPCQKFDESRQLVARTLDSTNFGVVWDKFQVFQGHRRNTPYIQIGRKGRKPRRLKVEKHANAFKQAVYYQDLLESGQADSQGQLARLCSTPRTTISAYLRLLSIDEKVRAEALSISDDDPRIALLTEPRLRSLPSAKSGREQRQVFRKLLAHSPRSTE